MTVGWYVHHHGSGHRHRLAAVHAHLPEVVGLGSGPAPGDVPWVALARDEDDDPRDPTAAGTLHWAPQGHPGLRDRMAQLAGWMRAARPSALVVDVSVEVALLGRLLGVPTVLVAQRGDRRDAPHALAYRQAGAVVAPWTEATHISGHGLPDDSLRFTGAVSRFDGHRFVGRTPGGPVLALFGSGGTRVARTDVEAAAAASPDRLWHVAGMPGVAGPNVRDHGHRADVRALLEESSVVVGTAGGNVVAEVAAARRPLVCLPQERPFAEQVHQAAALERMGAAVVCAAWPGAADWPAVLARAEEIDTARWDLLHDGGGAVRLASAVRAVAEAPRAVAA